jgi:hypothetical protein
VPPYRFYKASILTSYLVSTSSAAYRPDSYDVALLLVTKMTASGAGPADHATGPGRNSSSKREANNVLRDGVYGDDPRVAVAFFCECDDSRCYQAVWLTVDAYDGARTDPAWEAVIGEHRPGGPTG